MTDYLEELLEQQEQEEQGGTLEWRRLGGRVYAGGQYSAAAPDGAMGQHHAPDAERTSDAESPSAAAAVLNRQLDRLHRAVRQAQGQSARSAVSVQGGVQPAMAGSWHAGALSARRTADYAAAVDAAFQRDARRYDGPLSLL